MRKFSNDNEINFMTTANWADIEEMERPPMTGAHLAFWTVVGAGMWIAGIWLFLRGMAYLAT